MKITIDTKEDSHEEIRRVIKMLSSLIGDKEVFTNQGNIFDDPSPAVPMPGADPAPQGTSDIFGNMFGDSPAAAKEPPIGHTQDIWASEEPKIKEKKEDIIEIVEYE